MSETTLDLNGLHEEIESLLLDALGDCCNEGLSVEQAVVKSNEIVNDRIYLFLLDKLSSEHDLQVPLLSDEAINVYISVAKKHKNLDLEKAS